MKYPNTITAWIKDDSMRKASWERLLITRCRWQERKGANPSTNGDTIAREILIIIDGATCTLSRGDCVLLGMHIDAEPPQESATVNTVKPVYIGKKVHHFEVIAS